MSSPSQPLAVIAKLLDLTERRVQQLSREGVIPKAERGRYDLVGAVKGSKHLEGAAFDIAMANHDPHAFEAAAREAGFLGFGFYAGPRHDLMHIDLGPAREWGRRWPVTAATFTPEPPAPKPLAESRTMRGSGAAGLATVGAAGVEVAQEALAETQAAIEPLVPYLDTLRWVFIGVALVGIGVAVYARWDDWRRGER